MKVHVTTFGQTGTLHAKSEDRFCVRALSDGGVLCVVADGVGMGRDPDRSAERAVRIVADNFSARPRQWSVQTALERLIEQANDSLYREGAYVDGVPSMQTTLSAVCVMGNRVYGINVGDSPVFLVRDRRTQRLSRSHVRVNGDGKEILTNAVGMGPNLKPHYFENEIRRGDMVVMASDGLTRLDSDESLGEAVSESRSARRLIQQTIENSNSEEVDDLSAVVVDVEEIGPEMASPDLGRPLPFPAKDDVFDGHRLVRPLCGNSRVWLAQKEGHRFVLKFAPAEVETDDSGILAARFAREAANAVRMQGEFFVPGRLPEDGSPWYYIMDYLEAPSLRFALKSRFLKTEEVVELGRFLCRAEQFLLRSELVHGDIKPENLLVSLEAGEIAFKLLDLGLTTPVFTDASTSGTPSYLAPERFEGAMITERTEIYSIGATLYEALTGRPPFGFIERFQQPHFGPLKLPSRWNPHVPLWLDAVVFKCLRVQKEKRYQHFSELLYALEHPEDVPLDFGNAGPLLERNPLLLFKVGFWLLLIVVLILLVKLIS